MRSKIIAVNAFIIVIVGVMAFFFVRLQKGAAATHADELATDTKQNVQGAAARLQLDGLGAERWMTVKAGEPATLDPITKSGSARGDSATHRCDELVSQMKSIKQFATVTLVEIVDDQGKVIGRNNSPAQRGDDVAALYPNLKATTLTTGQPGSDVWYANQDRYLATYVAVHDDKGKIAGALIIGRALADSMSAVSDATTNSALALVTAGAGDEVQIVAKSSKTDAAMEAAITKTGGAVQQSIKKLLKDGQGLDVVRDGDLFVASSTLDDLGNSARVVLVSPGSASSADGGSPLLPILGACALGIVFVIFGGWVLGGYITTPINTLEEGLLAILNGQADKRFELDHAELGGLAFRIDQLLNQLMGVEEDNTDADGRVSQGPSAAHFSDAMGVEEKRSESDGTLDATAIAKLASEAAPAYYSRIYREYISAKRALNEPTDHITEQAFATRIQGMEQEAAQKYGKPVRYQVQSRNKEVVLLAIPLP